LSARSAVLALRKQRHDKVSPLIRLSPGRPAIIWDSLIYSKNVYYRSVTTTNYALQKDDTLFLLE
jgi:hypothetical protein